MTLEQTYLAILDDPRFQKPESLTFNHFEMEGHRRIRYATAPVSTPQGTVFILPGLHETTEKYYETIHDLQARGFGVAMMDWPYQGGSYRHPKHPHRRASEGFDSETAIFAHWVQHVLPAQPAPHYILAHSTGGNHALRYLAEYNDHTIKGALLSAPLLDLKLPAALRRVAPAIALTMRRFGFENNILFGRSEITLEEYEATRFELTPNEGRSRLHYAWFLKHPELASLAATFSWLDAAFRAFAYMRKPTTLARITTPVILARAEHETLVSNVAINRVARLLPQAELAEIKGAGHEILMGNDEHREAFFTLFDEMTQK